MQQYFRKYLHKFFNGGKQYFDLNTLDGQNDLPSVKEFTRTHIDLTMQRIDCNKMFTSDPETSNIAQKVFKNYNHNSDFYNKNIFTQPSKLQEECGSIKVLISDIGDFPQYEEMSEKYANENRMLAIGGPAAEDQVVLANIVDGIRNKLVKTTFLTRDYKESNVNHSAKQSHARHGNALNADDSLTGHALLPTFFLRKLLGVTPEETLAPDYKKIDIKFEISPRKLKIYFGNEWNWLKQEWKKRNGELTEHDINRLESILSQEILHIVEKQAGMQISSDVSTSKQDPAAIHVVFTKENNEEVKHENEEFAKVGIQSKRLSDYERAYFFPHNKGILSAYKYYGDTSIKFDVHERNQKYASENGVDWIDGAEVERILIRKNSEGKPQAVGVITKNGKFIPANKIHMTGGYKVDYDFDPESTHRFKGSKIRNFTNSIEDKIGVQKPLNNELTTATGVSMNLVFKNTPEMKAILEKHNGFAFAVTNSHWTPIAYDDEHIVVRATGGGNTGSEKYNPAYLLNVLANTRRIFGDTFIGVLSSYGCPRAVNAKNSTEFAKIADGLIISYGKGGTGNTKRHAEAVFALMELGYSNEVIDYFNQFNTGKGLPMGDEIKKIHEETKKNGFFHDNMEKTGRRMGYDDKLSGGEKFVAAVGAVLAGSALYKLYSQRQDSKLKPELPMKKLI